jgi:hypothetical protein
MSHYARNHLQDDWAAHSAAEMQLRIREAETTAGWYFDQATRPDKAEFDAALHTLLGVTGPRANRARDAAKAHWQEATREARSLLDATVACLLRGGEVSAELDEAWTTLTDRRAATTATAAE